MDTRVKPAYDNGEYRSALPAITTDHASFRLRELCRRLASPAGMGKRRKTGLVAEGGQGFGRSARSARFPAKLEFQTADTTSRSRGAIRPRFSINFLNPPIRGRRECRAPMRRGKKCARSSHGHTGITRHSPRNGFTVSFVLSPAIGLFCHRHRRNCFHRLDTSVEMSGPHDFTVRIGIARLARQGVHRSPSLRP
jgi:hypothetical protein